jgi:hypothetical protein
VAELEAAANNFRRLILELDRRFPGANLNPKAKPTDPQT